MSIRERFEKALSGEPIERPVFAVYDWFVNNRDIDWLSLFGQGLGQINHANMIECERPNLEIIETKTEENEHVRTDVRWITGIGELNEWYLDEWRQEYFIKSDEDYRIMLHALSDTTFSPTNKYYDQSEAELGNKGITLGQLGPIPSVSRTPFQRIQIDFTGLERFSLDISDELTALLDLIELMNEQLLKALTCTLETRARHIKLWENLTIETMGPSLYHRYLVPLYERIFEALGKSNKKILVHYDGKLHAIADDIKRLAFDGIDSLTPPPEGDMTIVEARRFWPDKFFWLHPNLGWYHIPDDEFIHRIRQMAKDAGPCRYCMMISEEVPHHWERTVPVVLQTLSKLI